MGGMKQISIQGEWVVSGDCFVLRLGVGRSEDCVMCFLCDVCLSVRLIYYIR